MFRTIMSRTFLLGFVATGYLALRPAPVWAITVAPSWETPELIPTDPSNVSPMPLDRVDGQDRFLDFDHFGVAGLAVPRLAGTSLGVAYWRRHPVVGWTQQNTGQSSSGSTTSVRSHHASLAFDRSERPVIAAAFNLSDNKDLHVFQLQQNGVFFARDDIVPTNSDANAGTTVAVDPLGRTGIAWVGSDAFVQYTLDADGNGMFDDDVGGTPLRLFVGAGTRPSLDFDPIARPYIGFIDENGHVGVSSGDVGLAFGRTTPDPNVQSSFVSLAVNPLTGLPAAAYNDLGNNRLKYTEFDGQQWNTEVVYTGDIASTADFMSVSLAFDPADGNPAIAFAGDRQLLDFAWHDGADWNVQTVDARTGVAAGAVSLAFNEAFPGGFGDGLPAIAYVATNGDYHYVEDPPLVLPGDFNEDGAVDTADYTAWRNGLGTIYTQEDYAVWRSNFGAVAAGAAAARSAASIPEPASLASLLVVSFVLLASGRRATKE